MNNVSNYLYAKASDRKIPLGGAFEISPVCNFSCKMCYVRRTPAQIKSEGKRLREWTEWVALAEKCKAEGMLYLLLTGGEPFIYPNFKKLYMALHEMGIIISINSNGTMIDKETVEWLKKAAPSRVNITLYGSSPETYARICGQADGYYRAVAAIDMLQKAGIPVVVNTSMIPENQADLEEIMEFCRERKLNCRPAVYMFPPVRREREDSDSRFSPTKVAKMHMRRAGFQLRGEAWQEYLKNELAKVKEVGEEEQGQTWGDSEEYMKCRAGRSSFWISWDGSMSACGLTGFPVVQYPFKDDFKECWRKLTEAVRTTSVLQECNNCLKREICKPCVAMIHAETGDVNKKAPYLCEMTDHIIANMKQCLEAET